MPEQTNYSLADTWLLSNRVNLKLLEELTEDQLALLPNPRARRIADQFAHLHNVRLMWLEHSAPSLMKGLRKIEKGGALEKNELREALNASAAALGNAIAEAEKTGRMKGYKRGPAAFLGYALAHEAHHRGQILVHLKYAKQGLDKMFGFALWEWEKI